MRKYYNTIEEFRQLKKEIGFQKDWLLVGVDVAKHNHWAHFILSNGEEIKKKYRFSNDRCGFEQFYSIIETLLNQRSIGQVVFGVEPTAGYEKHLSYYLKEKFYPVVILPTLAVRRNREVLSGTWDKSDYKDASNIAYLLKQGAFQFYHFRDHKLEEVVRLIRLDETLRNLECQLKSRFSAHIMPRCFPELERVLRSTASRIYIEFLDHFPTPHAASKISLREMTTVLRDQFRGSNISAERFAAKVKTIHEIAQNSIALQRPQLQGDVLEVKLLAQNLRTFREQRKQTNLRIHASLETNKNYQLLLTIPCIGEKTAALLVVEIGDINRFKHVRQLIKFIGYDLSKNQSGKYEGPAKMSKRGNARIRRCLWMAMNNACACTRDTNPSIFRQKYLQMMKKRHNNTHEKRKVKCALCVKMVRVIWAVLKNQVPYEEKLCQTIGNGNKMQYSANMEADLS